MARSAFISPLQLFSLAVNNQAHNDALAEVGGEEFELVPIVCSSLIQSGLDQLLLPEKATIKLTTNPSIEKRIKKIEVPSFEKTSLLVSELLRENRLPNATHESTIWLWAFLVEFLYALQLRQPMVSFFKPPAPESFLPFLKTEIAIPIQNLLKSFNPVDLDVATQSLSISLRDATVFENIVCDNLYDRYVIAHSGLDDSSRKIQTAQADIASASKNIAKRHNAIRIESATIGMLTFSSKFIDTVLGGIPGKLGQELVVRADEYLQDRQRLVIYQYDDLVSKITATNYLSKLAHNPIQKPTVNPKF